MSQENVEVVRAVYRTWSDGDLEAFLGHFDPAFELRTSGYFPDFAPIYRGHDGIRRFWDSMRAPWDWFHMELDRIVLGDERAATAVHFRAQGKGSGVTTDLQFGHAIRFRSGLIVSMSAFTSFDQALEAVGLSE